MLASRNALMPWYGRELMRLHGGPATVQGRCQGTTPASIRSMIRSVTSSYTSGLFFRVAPPWYRARFRGDGKPCREATGLSGSGLGTALLQQVLFAEAEVVAGTGRGREADNDVVDDLDANELAGCDQVLGARDVLCGRRRVSARVPMRENHL